VTAPGAAIRLLLLPLLAVVLRALGLRLVPRGRSALRLVFPSMRRRRTRLRIALRMHVLRGTRTLLRPLLPLGWPMLLWRPLLTRPLLLLWTPRLCRALLHGSLLWRTMLRGTLLLRPLRQMRGTCLGRWRSHGRP